MPKVSIKGEGLPEPRGAYSTAIKSGDTLYISGQRPVDPASGKMPSGIEAQTQQVLSNIEATLKVGRLTLDDVVKVTIYLANKSDWDVVNTIYANKMPAPYPARTTVEVGLNDMLVEIDAIACAD